jgi:hypothetical protein
VAADPRSEIRVRDGNHTYDGLSTQCTLCHTDEHHGRQVMTARCHTEQSWKPPSRFGHGTAKFPLSGRRAQLQCTDCHRQAATGQPVQFSGLRFEARSACRRDPSQIRISGKVRILSQLNGLETRADVIAVRSWGHRLPPSRGTSCGRVLSLSSLDKPSWPWPTAPQPCLQIELSKRAKSRVEMRKVWAGWRGFVGS